MPAPGILRVKLSSEAAGAISLTPVVVRDLPFRELLEEIAAVCGKDVSRIAEILRRGNLVGGATRFRWQPVEMTTAELAAALAFLPDPDPDRAFAPARCTQAVFAGPGVSIPLERDAGLARRLFRHATFWDALMQASSEAAYVTYRYRERADLYRAALSLEHRARIRAALPLLKNRALAQQLTAAPFDCLNLLVPR
ncbi:MAG: hypothetical protein ABSC08_18410 [Bryobacteraceae bacterium]|jgi:hypothetical protein